MILIIIRIIKNNDWTNSLRKWFFEEKCVGVKRENFIIKEIIGRIWEIIWLERRAKFK